MKKLSKEQLAEKAKQLGDVSAAKDKFEEAINDYNQATEQAWIKVTEALEILSSFVQARKGAQVAEDWRSAIYEDMESYYDDKTEKWQEGDAVLKYSDWKETWGEEFEIPELDEPGAIEVPDFDVIDKLENLPEEP